MLFTHKYYVHCPHGWRPDGSSWRNAQSFYEYIAAAALHLAGKVEENQKPLNDVVFTCHLAASEVAAEGDAKKKRKKREKARAQCTEDPKYFQQLKNRILDAEKNLLHNIGFALNVPRPENVIATTGHTIQSREGSDCFEMQNSVVQRAWSFANDSYRTTIGVQYNVVTQAAAMLVLAMKYSGKSENGQWWRSWLDKNGFRSISVSAVCDITSQLCELYSKNNAAQFAQLHNSIQCELDYDHDSHDEDLTKEQNAHDRSDTQKVESKALYEDASQPNADMKKGGFNPQPKSSNNEESRDGAAIPRSMCSRERNVGRDERSRDSYQREFPEHSYIDQKNEAAPSKDRTRSHAGAMETTKCAREINSILGDKGEPIKNLHDTSNPFVLQAWRTLQKAQS